MTNPMTLTSRERVLTALNHREPDRLPFDIGGTILSSAKPVMQQAIADVLGLTGEPDPRFPEFDNRIQEYFGCDLRSISPAAPCGWGVKWGDLSSCVLEDATINDLENYPWPEPSDALIAGLEDQARFLRDETDYFICAGQVGQGIFEISCWLRGYEQTLYDLVDDHEFIHAFNRKIVEVNRRLGDVYFGCIGSYVDMVIIGDDYATQDSPYMAPAQFRELYKPYFAEYIADIKRHCPQAKIAHHCCGSSWLLMDDLIEIGVDVINPVQTTAAHMAPENLATRKPQLAFHGGVDLQHVLPFGSSEEVEDFVKHLIRHLAPGGGYILAACHSLPHDVKPQNVVTMLETAKSFGTYPIEQP